MRRFKVILFLLCVFPVFLFSDEGFLDEVIRNMEKVKMEQYAYTVTTINNGKRTVEQHDPDFHDTLKWILVSTEERTPTAKEQAEYKEKKLKMLKQQEEQAEKNRKKQAFSFALNDFLKKENLKFVSETEATVIYAYKPISKSDDLMAQLLQKVDCLLYMDKSGKHISRIFLENPAPFSPSFGIEIKKFKLEMSFSKLAGLEGIFITNSKSLFQGSAFIFKQFDEENFIAYNQYQYRGTGNK